VKAARSPTRPHGQVGGAPPGRPAGIQERVAALPLAGALAAIVLLVPSARAAPLLLIPPVDGAITRRFEPPASEYGPGHRGIDYGVPAGSSVRAAAAGTVTFAGPVGGAQAVAVAHGGGMLTTYSRLADVYVLNGESVGRGHWLGTVGESHPGGPEGVHLGVKLNGAYVDPERFMEPIDSTRAIHLAPVEEGESSGCRLPSDLRGDPPPPNDNIAIALPGISTETAGTGGTDEYRAWLDRLGYRGRDSYVFSYRGSDGPRLHERYPRSATYGSLETAARRLRAMLARLAGARPGVDVDLIAHSQGGVVARAYLERMAASWDPRLPRVEHVVTLGAPFGGAPAAAIPEVAGGSLGGRIAVGALSWLAERGWLPLPGADAQALVDLTPRSKLLTALARQDVAYGTRVLSLVMPHDLLVPADRSQITAETFRVVAPRGLWGHGAILGSERARALAYDFLRDAPEPCRGAWDVAGPLLGRALGWAYAGAGRLLP
jgi:alpha-beta hydrolase superfamily lysophospholipase